MRLVHLSDLHFGALSAGLPDELLRAIGNIAPDLVVISGDLSQRGTRVEFQAARAFLDSLTVPHMVVPGNHDMPHGFRLWERFRKTWQHFLSEIRLDLESVWQNDEVAICGANSAKPAGWYLDWSRGHLSHKQLKRIKDVFADVPEHLLRVLVVHHPPALPPRGIKRYVIDKRDALMPALKEAGVDLILSGHFHVSYAVVLALPGVQNSSCVLSVVSTATSHRLQGEPNGFHLIETKEKEITITPHTWTGAAFAGGSVWHFEPDDAQGWREVTR